MQTKSVAIVTGASQGIGRATAIRLARDFGAVVLAARQGDELKKTAAEVQSAGAEALTCALDLREPRSSISLFGHARSLWQNRHAAKYRRRRAADRFVRDH